MGNSSSFGFEQLSYKFCEKCNNCGELNTAIECVGLERNQLKYTSGDTGGNLLLRCDHGHLFTYCSNFKRCKFIQENLTKNKSIAYENEQLKLKVLKLEKIIDNLKNNDNLIPSAPVETTAITMAFAVDELNIQKS